MEAQAAGGKEAATTKREPKAEQESSMMGTSMHAFVKSFVIRAVYDDLSKVNRLFSLAIVSTSSSSTLFVVSPKAT